ncbi:hypothetical protein [Saccharopolyspora shandongensis]|uniref:hypothetical protein n=1 Tax=Saccharopolyspora shandongensis TaxID=418495 RepID=UPI0034093A15
MDWLERLGAWWDNLGQANRIAVVSAVVGAVLAALGIVVPVVLGDSGSGSSEAPTPPATADPTPSGTTTTDASTASSGHGDPSRSVAPSTLTLTVSPDAGSRGSTATVTGEGFHPGERVRVTWGEYPSTGKALKDVAADANGTFSAEVVIPAKRQHVGDWDYHNEGTMRIIATGLTSERQADTYYRYTL